MDLDQFEEDQKKKEEEHLYRFIQGGKHFVLPPFGSLDRTLMEAADEDFEFMNAAFRLAMGEDQFAEWDELPLSLDGLNRLFKDWGDHSGMDTGK
jgi:hypothetical protein